MIYRETVYHFLSLLHFSYSLLVHLCHTNLSIQFHRSLRWLLIGPIHDESVRLILLPETQHL